MIEQMIPQGRHSDIAIQTHSVATQHSTEIATVQTTLHCRQSRLQLASGAARPALPLLGRAGIWITLRVPSAKSNVMSRSVLLIVDSRCALPPRPRYTSYAPAARRRPRLALN